MTKITVNRQRLYGRIKILYEQKFWIKGVSIINLKDSLKILLILGTVKKDEKALEIIKKIHNSK